MKKNNYFSYLCTSTVIRQGWTPPGKIFWIRAWRGIPFGEVLTINPKNWYCVKMYNIVSSKIQDVLKSNFRLKYFLSWWSWGLVPWRWTEYLSPKSYFKYLKFTRQTVLMMSRYEQYGHSNTVLKYKLIIKTSTNVCNSILTKDIPSLWSRGLLFQGCFV